jgi:hypothetical protein
MDEYSILFGLILDFCNPQKGFNEIHFFRICTFRQQAQERVKFHGSTFLIAYLLFEKHFYGFFEKLEMNCTS